MIRRQSALALAPSNQNVLSIKKNTIWNVVGSVSPMLLGLITIPYLIRQVGLEVFGILTLVWALIGYFSIFDFGIGRALTHQVSINRSSPRQMELAAVVKNGLLLVASFGALGGLVLAASAYQLGFNWLNVSTDLRQSAATGLLIAAVGIPLATLATGLRGLLEGFEEFRVANLLRVLLGCANFGFPALSVMAFGPSLELMVASLVFARSVALIAHWFAVRARVGSWRGAKWFDKPTANRLLSFGVWMTVSNIISPLMVTADRFVISYLLGAGVVAFYTVPFEFIIRVLVVPAALTAALFPRFAYLHANDADGFALLYWKGVKATLIVMLPLCTVLALGSFAGLQFWLGQEFAKNAWPIASILSVGLLFNALAQIPHAAIQAMGNVRATALVHFAEFLLYLPCLVVATQMFGLVGAAVVWVARVLLDLIALAVLARRQTR